MHIHLAPTPRLTDLIAKIMKRLTKMSVTEKSNYYSETERQFEWSGCLVTIARSLKDNFMIQSFPIFDVVYFLPLFLLSSFVLCILLNIHIILASKIFFLLKIAFMKRYIPLMGSWCKTEVFEREIFHDIKLCIGSLIISWNLIMVCHFLPTV